MAPVDWQQAWKHGTTPWDEGESPPALFRLLAEGRVPAGRVFVPGCGAGYDLATLAHPERDVIGLDLSEDARSAFVESHSDLPGRVTYEVGNFFAYEPTDTFDFVWDYTFFCALDPPRRSEWAAVMTRLMRLDGLLATLLFPYADPIPDTTGPPWPINTHLVGDFLGNSFQLVEAMDADQTHPGREGKERLALWRRQAPV